MTEQPPAKGSASYRLFVGISIAVLVAVAPAYAAEDSEELGRKARNIAENINSPFCKATTLASCGSGEAAAWRADIRQWVQEGVPEHEICQRLSDRAGRDLCGKPSPAVGAALPILLSLLAVSLLALILRRFVADSPRTATEGAEPPADDPELDAALDRELERLDED